MVSLNDALADTAAQVEKFLDQLLAVEDATEHRLHGTNCGIPDELRVGGLPVRALQIQ